MFIPEENIKDVPTDLKGIQVIPVKTVAEILEEIFHIKINELAS
ncbi:hypothetical protein N752_24365 [Desulforamulus aquiferis]|nr:hypothetical protein N752_24365 [Desulforamulus aquiferis]